MEQNTHELQVSKNPRFDIPSLKYVNGDESLIPQCWFVQFFQRKLYRRSLSSKDTWCHTRYSTCVRHGIRAELSIAYHLNLTKGQLRSRGRSCRCSSPLGRRRSFAATTGMPARAFAQTSYPRLKFGSHSALAPLPIPQNRFHSHSVSVA